MLLNTHTKLMTFGSVTDLLNGAFASLSGPVGFTPRQPTIIVRRIQVSNNESSGTVLFSIFKGASGASAANTQVLIGNCAARGTVDFETEIVLDAADFLTGTCLSNTDDGPLVVNISAEIYP